jgi:phosphoglycolate phosphatase-like HAD superfamily hydrolase
MVDFYQTNIASEEGYVLPGVNEFLNYLEGQNVVIGLLTGNLQQIAQLKIKKNGIEHSFEFGGFGDEHYSRGMLIKYAIRKAIKIYGFKPESAWKNSYHIGDTPQDVIAAKYANVKSIIVETGNFKINEHFKENQPDFFIKNFSEREEVEKLKNFLNLS